MSTNIDSAAPGGDVERRAQKLFRTMMCAPYGNTTVGNIVCYEATYERLESTWLPIIIAALSAPKQVGETDTLGFDFYQHLHRQRDWSKRTFGPGARTAGVIDHIRKELREIEANPNDLCEWIDVAILAFDGAWRSGASPLQIIETLVGKQTKNEGRTWPDWRTADPNKAIEHDRSQ